MHRRKFLLGAGGLGLAGAAGGYLGRTLEGDAKGSAIRGEPSVAVTTSTDGTGLLDELHASFEERFGVRVAAIAGGSGQNVRRGESGDVDAVMAHAPELEAAFLRSGHGIDRRDFAFGDFVVLGPPDDPAGAAEADTARDAFERIAAAEATFYSRGDDSGTHRAELDVWATADAGPSGEWYLETGRGMGDTLVQANQQRAYLLSVRGNYVAMRDRLDLTPVVEGPVTGGDPALENPYGLIAVNPARHPDVEYELASLYIGCLTGPRGQAILENYEVNGEQLFFADGVSETPNFEQYHPPDDAGNETGSS